METNKTITSIKLEKCEFEEKDILPLTRVFTVHSMFERIEMTGNHFRDTDMVKIARAIGECKDLKELDLSCCGFSDAGAQAIVEAVIDKPLIKINLSNNMIADEGAKYLSEAFSKHQHVRVLYIDSNPSILNVGKTALSHLVQRNLSLQEIKFGDVHLTSETIASLRLLHYYGVRRA
jgi:Ran GTPase-activating protein (RanGAP) involved in mRNA processing and transport